MKITANTKVLCLCEQGQARSVATRFALHKMTGNGNVLAAGIKKNNSATLVMLADWADVILVCGEEELLHRFGEKYRAGEEPHCMVSEPVAFAKIVHINIGLDRWGNPFGNDLVDVATALLKEHIG